MPSTAERIHEYTTYIGLCRNRSVQQVRRNFSNFRTWSRTYFRNKRKYFTENCRHPNNSSATPKPVSSNVTSSKIENKNKEIMCIFLFINCTINNLHKLSMSSF